MAVGSSTLDAAVHGRPPPGQPARCAPAPPPPHRIGGMTTPAHVPLVVATRGDTVENVHYGSIAVVDRGGRLLWSAGDPRAATVTRSTLKAFQALPLMRADGPRQFGFD